MPVRFAVLTLSDTRTLADDRSGDTLVARIEAAGHTFVARALAGDDVTAIRTQIARWTAQSDIDVILTTGGTGLTGRDVTIEAIRPLFEKEIDGFATIFHLISFQKIATSTIQSRACAGLIAGKFVFCLPGSPGACRDAWDEILVKQFDIRHKPCNFVEIFPRLDEHLRRKT